MWKYLYTDELYHHGVKGMKWGIRKKPTKQQIQDRSEQLKKQANELYKKSLYAKEEARFFKKHPKAAYDDFGDYLADKPKLTEKLESEPNYKKAIELRSRAHVLDKNYSNAQALGSDLVASVYLAPVAMYATAKMTKGKLTGAKRTAAVLASGFGTVAVTDLASRASSSKERRKVIKEEFGN